MIVTIYFNKKGKIKKHAVLLMQNFVFSRVLIFFCTSILNDYWLSIKLINYKFYQNIFLAIVKGVINGVSLTNFQNKVSTLKHFFTPCQFPYIRLKNLFKEKQNT